MRRGIARYTGPWTVDPGWCLCAPDQDVWVAQQIAVSLTRLRVSAAVLRGER